MNGGMQRCFHIIHQLAKYFDLTAIIHQHKENFFQAANAYPEISSIKIYSTRDEKRTKDLFSLLPVNLEEAMRYRWIKKDFTKSADGSFLKYYPVLKRLLKNNQYDTIILENLFTTNATKTIRKYAKTATIIYDAHNVDSNLATYIESKHLNGIRKAESNLYKNVNALFACSENDKSDFLRMNNYKLPVAVIPNGVCVGKLSNQGMLNMTPDFILFCGALWTAANREGLLWFYDNVWPAVRKSYPNLKLLIVGSGELTEGSERLTVDPSLVFSGSVKDVKPFYDKATVAIVPLLSGSGTRLKILEAMGFGLPVISTAKGAEGIKFTNEKDIIIADNAKEFSEKLIRLLGEQDRRILISISGREMVEKKYDWNIIGKIMRNFINSFPFATNNSNY